jgi:hypothetical protein
LPIERRVRLASKRLSRDPFVHRPPHPHGRIAVEGTSSRRWPPIWKKGDRPTARRALARIEATLSCALPHGWRSAANAAADEHIAPKRPKDGGAPHHPNLPSQDAPAVVVKMRLRQPPTNHQRSNPSAFRLNPNAL